MGLNDPFPHTLEDTNSAGRKNTFTPTEKCHEIDTANNDLAMKDTLESAQSKHSSQESIKETTSSSNGSYDTSELRAMSSSTNPSDSFGKPVFLRGMCCLKPILIDNIVVVYEAIDEPEKSLLKPVIQYFIRNMEDEVPEELVKIG